MFILLPGCATLLNLYGKIKNVLGFGIIEEDDEESPAFGGWREGRDLIARDLSGQGSTTLGLRNSPRPSLDRSRAGPTRWVPPANPSSRAAALRSQPALEPESDEENFFTLFGRRMKNTIDAIDTPKWMQPKKTGGGLKKPKWMGGQADGGGGSSGQGSVVLGSRTQDGRITI